MNVFELVGEIVVKIDDAIKNLKKVENAVEDTSETISDKTGKSLKEIAAESGKTVNQIRSEIMKAAAEYKKQGLSQSEAMKKAYADIGYAVEESSGKVKKLGKTTQTTGDKMLTVLKKVSGAMVTVGTTITKIGDKLTKYITKPAIVAGTALAGVVLAKGWSRMTEIDNAKIKLQAIGNTVEDVAEIMNNATASVKGTAYGLDEAAATAASAVAAGIKPGKKLESYLTAIADAAAVAGTDMSDMGAIFNKVATQSKATNEILQQMAERGIPIYQYLADEIGVTTSQVYALASDGQISLQQFQTAVETHIGGAAKTIGSSTISGALSNINASVSRIGANFLGSADDADSFAGKVLPLLNDFTMFLGGIEDKAKLWGATFGEVFGAIIEYFRTGNTDLSNLSDTAAVFVGRLTPVIDKVKSIASAFSSLSTKAQIGLGTGVLAAGPLISTLGKVITIGGKVGSAISAISTKAGGLSGVFSALTSPVGLVVAAITALAAIFVYLMATNEEFRSTVMNCFSQVMSAVMPVVQNLMTVLQQVGGILINTLLAAIQQFAPILRQIVTAISQILSALMPMIDQLVNALAPVIQTIVTVLSNVLTATMPSVVAILNVVMSVIRALVPVITDILSVVVSAVAEIIAVISPIIAFIGGVISSIMAIISPIITFVADIIASSIEIIGTIIGVVTQVFATVSKVVSDTFNGISAFITNCINTVCMIIAKVSNAVSSVFNAVYNIISQLFGKARDFIGATIDKVTQKFNSFKNSVSNVWNAIWSVVKSVVNKIIGGVEKMVNGVVKGINKILSGVSNIANSVGSLLGLDPINLQLKEISLPRLAKGGVLERGQVGVLEGDGAEAVVPLEQNLQWLGRLKQLLTPIVTASMEALTSSIPTYGGMNATNVFTSNNTGVTELLTQILNRLEIMDKTLYDKLVTALVDGVTLKVNDREVARVTRKYAGQY